jgi:hypothetical protein
MSTNESGDFAAFSKSWHGQRNERAQELETDEPKDNVISVIKREEFLSNRELSKVLALAMPTQLDYEDAEKLCQTAVKQQLKIQQARIDTLELEKNNAQADRDDRNHTDDLPAKIKVSGLTGDASKANGIYTARHDHLSITDMIHGKPVYVQQGSSSRHALHDDTIQKLFFHVEHEAGGDSETRKGED